MDQVKILEKLYSELTIKERGKMKAGKSAEVECCYNDFSILPKDEIYLKISCETFRSVREVNDGEYPSNIISCLNTLRQKLFYIDKFQ